MEEDRMKTTTQVTLSQFKDEIQKVWTPGVNLFVNWS